jgi:hypothetical protein
LLVLADFSQLSYRTIGIGACSDRVDPGVCKTYGHDSHSYVLVVVGLLALVMAWGAVVGRSRAAAVAVGAVGVVVLFIALVIDLPKLDEKRGLEVRYNDVSAHTGAAFKLELTGGVLLLLVGGLALVRAGSEAEPWQPSGRLRLGRGRGDDGVEGGDDDDASGLTPAEARARERARRRAQSTAGGADPMPPPAPAAAADTPPAGDAPPPAADADTPPPPEGDAAPQATDVDTPPPPVGDAAPQAADPDTPAAPEGSGWDDRSGSTTTEADLDPEAYRPPSPGPDPPTRG